MFVKESLSDILKPKSQEHVMKELKKFSLEQKMEAIESTFYDPGDMMQAFDDAGADTNKIVTACLKSASRKELIEIIEDLITYEGHVVELFMDILEPRRKKNALSMYLTDESKAELNDLMNDIILKNIAIIGELTDKLQGENEEWFDYD